MDSICSARKTHLDADHDEGHVGEDELEAGRVGDAIGQLRDQVVAA